MAAHRMTPARRAALKKAQAASAKKRRGTGKGKLAKANRTIGKKPSRVGAHLRRHHVKYAAGAVVAGYAAGSYLAARSKHKAQGRKSDHAHAQSRARYANIHASQKRSSAKSKFYAKTRPHVASKGPTRHNRVFVTTRHGTTSVRKRGH